MLISSKGHYATKVKNSYIMINMLGITFPERSQNVETDLTLWEPSKNVLQTLGVSWDDL